MASRQEERPMIKQTKRVALVCANFTMQSAFGMLILALNSARLGYETIVFFTFEGLGMIRRDGLDKLRYYPTGMATDDAAVERFTRELQETMERKDIPYIEDMLEMSQLEGVRFLACKTSADLFDLTEADFIDGVELTLAGDFMKLATESDLHMVF
jgi:peroxiredoxin family protein